MPPRKKNGARGLKKNTRQSNLCGSSFTERKVNSQRVLAPGGGRSVALWLDRQQAQQAGRRKLLPVF